MGNVTQKDIDFMNNISNIVDGNFNHSLAQPVQSQRQASRPMNNVGFTPDSSGMYMDNMKRYMQIVSESCGDSTTNTSSNYSSSPLSSYDVVVEVDNSGTRVYKIKDESRQVFRNRTFLVCETALAISKILNSQNDDFSQKYIDNFIDLDEDFGGYKEKALYEKNNYMRAKTLNENKAADIFENNFKNYHSKANSTFEQIKSLYNLITK